MIKKTKKQLSRGSRLRHFRRATGEERRRPQGEPNNTVFRMIRRWLRDLRLTEPCLIDIVIWSSTLITSANILHFAITGRPMH
jgi:hypothetical protein